MLTSMAMVVPSWMSCWVSSSGFTTCMTPSYWKPLEAR